jgi:hypothetical protein
MTTKIAAALTAELVHHPVGIVRKADSGLLA